jgi:anti-sigma B factor antagonist
MTTATGFQSSFFRVEDAEGVTVLSMTQPRLTEDENLEQLDRDFNALADTFQVRKIVLDLGSVGYLTSAAIAKLISLHRRLARSEGQLVLCTLQEQVSSTLATSHLLNYFSVAANPDAARAQFG